MTKEITKDSVSIHLFQFFHNITEILFQSYLFAISFKRYFITFL